MVKSSIQVKVDYSGYSSSFDDALDFIVQQSEFVYPPEVHEMVVAAEELLLNIYRHAYESGDEGMIDIECLRFPEKRQFQMVIRDSGKPFDPTAWGNDTNVHVINCGRQSKGIGLMIAKRFLPDMRYQYENGQNVLTVTKYY